MDAFSVAYAPPKPPISTALHSMRVCAFFLVVSVLSNPLYANVDLVKVDKSDRKMYLYENGKILKEYDVSLGGSPEGHKKMEGDQKTPEGVYTLDYKKEDSSFYRAMHINYPSKADKDRAKKEGVDPGGFIMVHGQKNGFGWLSPVTQLFNWTNGCIAVTNDEIDEFMDLVKQGTKIEIQW